MNDDATLQQRVDDLTARLRQVRTVKHQMCNELMGALGHTQLLEQQPELSEKAQHRLERIREHCKSLAEQAEELTRICRSGTLDD